MPTFIKGMVDINMDVKLPVVVVYTTVGAISDTLCIDLEYVQPFIEP